MLQFQHLHKDPCALFSNFLHNKACRRSRKASVNSCLSGNSNNVRNETLCFDKGSRAVPTLLLDKYGNFTLQLLAQVNAESTRPLATQHPGGGRLSRKRWQRVPDEAAKAKEGHKNALLLAKRGDVKGARAAFDSLIAEFPSNVHILTSAGLFEWRNGQRGVAREHFKQGVAAHPANAPVRQAWGLMEAARGEKGTKRARELLKAATEADQYHGPSWQAWAVFEQRRGNIRMARQLFQKGAEMVPDHVPTLQAWGLLEASEGQFDEARLLFRQATTLDPTHGHAWLAWARLEWQQGNFEKARSLFKRGTEIPGKDAASILQAWASVEAEAKNELKARGLFRKAAHRDPKLPFTWLQWGRFESSQGRLDDAAEIFRTGLRVDPANAHLRHALGMLEKDRGNFQEARRVLTNALESAPENSHILGMLAEVEVATGAVSKARAFAQEALKGTLSNEAKAIMYEKLATIEANGDRPESARQIFADAVAASPADARILRSWALFEKSMGRVKEASELFRHSVKADPHLTRTWLQWALWELELGNIPKARAVFDRGLEFNPQSAYLFLAWAKLEEREKDFEMARELYEAGCKACPRYGPLWAEWGMMEWRVWRSKGEKNGGIDSPLENEKENGSTAEAKEVIDEKASVDTTMAACNGRTCIAFGVPEAVEETHEERTLNCVEVGTGEEEIEGMLYETDEGKERKERKKEEEEREVAGCQVTPTDDDSLRSVGNLMNTHQACLELFEDLNSETSYIQTVMARKRIGGQGAGEGMPSLSCTEQEGSIERLDFLEEAIEPSTDNLPIPGPESFPVEGDVIESSETSQTSFSNGYMGDNLKSKNNSAYPRPWQKRILETNTERRSRRNMPQEVLEIFAKGAQKAAHYPALFQKWKTIVYSLGNRQKAKRLHRIGKRQDADPYNEVPRIIFSAFQKKPRRRNWEGWSGVGGPSVERESTAQNVPLDSSDQVTARHQEGLVIKSRKSTVGRSPRPHSANVGDLRSEVDRGWKRYGRGSRAGDLDC